MRFPDGESYLLPRQQFQDRITGAYGWAINGRRPVGRLVDRDALTLHPGMGLAEASATMLNRDPLIRYDDVLIRTDRAVFGAISVADLGRLAERVVAELEGLAGRQVSVEASRLVATVDAAKVERILENLLTNVVRHTPPRTPVWVHVVPQEAGVLLMVEDAGPGVPPERLRRRWR